MAPYYNTTGFGGEDGTDEVGISANPLGVSANNDMCPFPFASIALVTSRARSRACIGNGCKSPLTG